MGGRGVEEEEGGGVGSTNWGSCERKGNVVMVLMRVVVGLEERRVRVRKRIAICDAMDGTQSDVCSGLMQLGFCFVSLRFGLEKMEGRNGKFDGRFFSPLFP